MPTVFDPLGETLVVVVETSYVRVLNHVNGLFRVIMTEKVNVDDKPIQSNVKISI